MEDHGVTSRRGDPGRVFISGYFGFGNLGDEAILEAVVLELRRRYPRLSIAATFGPDHASALRLEVTPVDFFDVEAVAHSIVGTGLVLFGLGGVFQDYWGASSAALFRQGTNGVEAWARPALLARMEHVPTALFCGGIGPLRTPPGRAMFAMACEAADLLVVRDDASALEVLDILPSAQPIVATDPAHLLEPDTADRGYGESALRQAGIGQPPIAVAVRAWDLGVERSLLVQLTARALATLPSDHPLVFLPFHRGAGTNDHEVAEAIRAALPDRKAAVVEVRTAGQAIALFERSILVVSARNHGVVFAGCAGAPVVPVSYDPKVASCAASVGVEQFLVEISELDRLPVMLSHALASRESVRQRMAARREGLLARARSAFDALSDLVASRSGEASQPSATAVTVDWLRGERGRLAEQLRRAGRQACDLATLERDARRLASELQSLLDTARDG